MSNYSKMFKAYDIRGTYPELNEKVYYWAGFGIVKEVLIPEGLPTRVNLVHDARYTSAKFFKALYNGIKDAGGQPVALGLGTTDFMYASTQVTGTPGIIVTASHNPKDDNGMKIVKQGSEMLGLESGLAKVRDFAVPKIEQDLDMSEWVEPKFDTDLKTKVEAYFMEKIFTIGQIAEVNKTLQAQNKTLNIAVDCGNGMGGWIMEKVKDIYTNINFVPLFWELNGNFPNHPADPQNLENLKDISSTIRSRHDVSFGIAFDGDADRAYAIDENGHPVQGDFLVAYFSKALLQRQAKNPNPDFDLAAVYLQPGSRCVVETIAENDGIAIPSRQGHTYIKAQMTKYRAVYGGEFSGHHYFGEFGFMDSGILAMVLFISLIVENGGQVSDLFKTLDKTYFISPLMNPSLPEGETFEDIKVKIKSAFKDAVISELDGISVFYPDWKFNMRPSNTEPVVRFILETRCSDTLDEKVELVRRVTGL